MNSENLSTQTTRFRRGMTLVITLGVTLAAVLICIQLLEQAPVAHTAGTINVSTTGDEYGAGSACSLREAIESINTNSSFGGCTNPGGADTVQLMAFTYTVSIIGPSFRDNSKGSLAPRTSMTIRGAGADQTVVRAANALDDWVFEVYTSTGPVAYAMEALTVQDGPDGGVSISIENVASAGATIGFSDMIVQNNQGPGVYLVGGAESTTFNLSDMLIRNNGGKNPDYGYGGGVAANYGGTTILTDVTISDNQSEYGGGIYYGNSYGTDSLWMTNVTIAGNTAEYQGGGVYMADWSTGGLTATNVTIAYNRSLSGTGASIYNNNSHVYLENTIVAHGVIVSGTVDNNCAGNPVASVSSGGHNLDSGSTCGLGVSGDLPDTDPVLDTELRDNGGDTPTLALLSGSPAIDAGDDSLCPATDQRGVARPYGSHCDIGAFEYRVPTASDVSASGVVDNDIWVTLVGSAPYTIDPLAYWVVSLPQKGTLYQYDTGSRGAGISTTPALVTESGHRVIFAPLAGESGDPYTTFTYKVNDGMVDSNIATVTIVVGTVDVYLPITLKEG